MQCQYRTSGCPGSANNNCYPYLIWSGTPSSSGYYVGYLQNGNYNVNSYPYASGVRCVLDLKPNADGCPGAGKNDNCEPNVIWSGTIISGESFDNYRYLNSGTFKTNSSPYLGAYSVRCVLDLKPTADSCTGAYNNNCQPNVVWADRPAGDSSFYRGNLNSGTFQVGSGGTVDYARSVRCILDLNNKQTMHSKIRSTFCAFYPPHPNPELE